MLDEISVYLIAGSGGNGIVSFRRERYVPRGGPDGGDGGTGGSIWIEASTSVLVLDDLRRKKTYKAKSGTAGGNQKRHGKNGKDVVLKVPVGTIIWEEDGAELADLKVAGMKALVAAGGAGGKGNARFATPTRRAPRLAERGLPGESRTLRLELRLLAEVGLVGLPNAGKSSLLRAMSAARPKVGAYPFTTLEPSLGIAELGYETVVVADIPGLIEGAHTGVGLGTRFLQHIRRTNVLVHVVDISDNEPLAAIDAVRGELREFGEGLVEKRWMAALNKIDISGLEKAAANVERQLKKRGVEAFRVSALTGAGVSVLRKAMFQAVMEEREAEVEKQSAEPAVISVPMRETVKVTKRRGRFVVKDRRAEEAALKLGTDSEEARAELARRLQRMGVQAALRKAGVKEGDWVHIANEELQWPL